jgi:hypothetical protein
MGEPAIANALAISLPTLRKNYFHELKRRCLRRARALARLSARDLNYPNRHRSEYRQQAGGMLSKSGRAFPRIGSNRALSVVDPYGDRLLVLSIERRGSLRPASQAQKSEKAKADAPAALHIELDAIRDGAFSPDVSCDPALPGHRLDISGPDLLGTNFPLETRPLSPDDDRRISANRTEIQS